MGIETLTTESCLRWIREFAATVDAGEQRLTALDSAIGDGDHGANLKRGLAAAVSALDDDPPATPGRVLIMAGRALIAKTGGASGPLYGTGLRRAGKALGDAAEANPAEVGEALAAMLAGIQELGGAAPGDKTMVDALTPAVAAFKAGAPDGLAFAASAAADAAEAGLAATVPMQARKGRASYLGERSIGHEDPGAASTALFVQALATTADSSDAP
jgi:phosphoenolpyruvate---glycerone phosphotransferase subunit DhaL